MPRSTLAARFFNRPLRNRSRTASKRSRLRFEVCEERCTPALFLNVGTHDLLPNTAGQEIEIFLQSTDPVNDPEIEFLNLHAEIGDAPHLSSDPNFDPFPNFEGVDFITGTIWDQPNVDPNPQTPGATPYDASGFVAFNADVSVVPNGKILTLTIDTTGFTDTSFDGTPFEDGIPLKFKNVGAQFNQDVATNVGFSQDNGSGGVDIVPVPITISNGTINIVNLGAPPEVDLNGSVDGTGSIVSFSQGDNPVAVVGTSGSTGLTINDSDSDDLVSASVTLQGNQDGADEVLAVNTAGTSIVANYNSGSGVLELTGVDSRENYQQVLRTLTYQNSANPLTPEVRTADVIVSDGTTPSTAVTATINAYDLSFPFHNATTPTDVNRQGGTTLTDAFQIVFSLRSNGSGPLSPVAPDNNPDYNRVDVDRNNRITLNDALLVVSFLRNNINGGGEGEFAPATVSSGGASDQSNDSGVAIALGELELEADRNAADHDLAVLALVAEM